MLVAEVEDEDGHVIVEAEGERRRVHHVEPLLEGVEEGEGVVFDGVGVLLGVLVVNTVDLGRLEDDIGVHLARAEGGGGVGGEIGVARAGGKDDYASLLQMTDCPAQDEGLGDLVHGNRGLDAGVDPHFFQAVHEGEAVDHRGEHAHVVAGGTVDAALFAGEAAEDVAPADHDAHLHAELVDFLHLQADLFEGRAIDGVAILAATEHLA